MSKSLGNSFLPSELFSGNHPLLQKGFSPMTVRFFMLQSHYSSTLDFSNDALNAAEKGYKKLSNALSLIKALTHAGSSTLNLDTDKKLLALIDECYLNMSDDFNTAKTLAVLFEMASQINTWISQKELLTQVGAETFEKFKTTYISFMEEALGLREEDSRSADAACRADASSRSTVRSRRARPPSRCTPSLRRSAAAAPAPSLTPSTPSIPPTRAVWASAWRSS
jgi:cysteinyl-tRNA synthetase